MQYKECCYIEAMYAMCSHRVRFLSVHFGHGATYVYST